MTFTRKGKICHLLTSMIDAMRYPGREITEPCTLPCEIELEYREIKQTMMQSRLSLQSKTGDCGAVAAGKRCCQTILCVIR
ncbi:hypothetical protein HMPREF0201_00170 [Cedecea davisae DSM 4568]|uniref:Uncharacterized protein n=1 Tax=Cedecea davisae DSM 4568 TaxID=566551 RepID=S3K5U4_9ENTR|nr:hypothetical protein HMPREF0201_00170 [Cedecea davisae DSM 4568]